MGASGCGRGCACAACRERVGGVVVDDVKRRVRDEIIRRKVRRLAPLVVGLWLLSKYDH